MLAPSPRKEVKTQTKESAKGRLPVKDSPDSPTEPAYSPDQRQRRSGGASRTPRKSSPAYCPLGEERAQSDKSCKRKAVDQRGASHCSSSAKKEEDSKKRMKRESPRKSAREAPTQREPGNSRKTSEPRKRSPASSRWNKEETRAVEPPAAQGDETDQDQGEEITVLGEKRGSENTEGERGQSQDHHFINAFKRSLDRKKQDLTERAEDLKAAPYNKRLRELVLQDQEDIKVLEDSI